MTDFASNAGKVLLAIREIALNLNHTDLTEDEIQVRDDWKTVTKDPMRGMSIVYMGEQYDDGTVGTQDVGYITGIILAKHRTADSTMADDKIIQWFEQLRRRLADQRLLITLYGPTAPKEHVCIVMPGKTLTNPDNWPNYLIRQLVVVSWIRELPTSF